MRRFPWILTVLTALGVALLLALGVWQVQRLKWKEGLIAAAEAAQGRLPLVAVGGIDSGAEAYRRIRLGATAVQVYSALIYEGPGLVGRITRDLAERLRADGFSTVSEAVGAGR
ncbi:hypothetical protein CCR92_21070 [Rhodospirillum rubrum]|nr:hypothetical protein [Rhodospirillum rubrum]